MTVLTTRAIKVVLVLNPTELAGVFEPKTLRVPLRIRVADDGACFG